MRSMYAVDVRSGCCRQKNSRTPTVGRRHAMRAPLPPWVMQPVRGPATAWLLRLGWRRQALLPPALGRTWLHWRAQETP